jgi:hypothetical protein
MDYTSSEKKTIISKITNNSAFNKGYLERWLLTKDEKTITKFISLSKIFRFVGTRL